MGTGGKAVVGDDRVAPCRRGRRERAERVVAGFRARHESSARPTESHDVAQVVGISIVVGVGRVSDDPHGDHLSSQRERHPLGRAAAGRHALFVGREGGVDLHSVQPDGHVAIAGVCIDGNRTERPRFITSTGTANSEGNVPSNYIRQNN